VGSDIRAQFGDLAARAKRTRSAGQALHPPLHETALVFRVSAISGGAPWPSFRVRDRTVLTAAWVLIWRVSRLSSSSFGCAIMAQSIRSFPGGRGCAALKPLATVARS